MKKYYRMSVAVAISFLFILLLACIDTPAWHNPYKENDTNVDDFFDSGNQSNIDSSDLIPYFQSDVENSNQNSSDFDAFETSKSRIGGNLIDFREEINYTEVKVGIFSSNDSKLISIISNLYGFSISRVESYEFLISEIEKWSVGLMTSSLSAKLSSAESIRLSAQLQNWVSQGHFLITDDTDIFLECFCDDNTSFNVTAIGKGEQHLVRFASSAYLALNLGSTTNLLTDDAISVFSIPEDEKWEIIANYVNAQTKEEFPIIVLARIGKGYCLLSGLSLTEEDNDSCVNIVNSIISNALQTYGEMQFSIHTRPFSILDPISPHLQPLNQSDPIMSEINSIAIRLRQEGFNVYYSNILYSDYNGSYFGKLTIKAPLEAFVRTFSCQVEFGYDKSPYMQLSSNSDIFSFTNGLFVQAAVQNSVVLLWPSGWNPPDVEYYHLSPNKLSAHDMGSDLWSPHSVEEIIRADDARNFGLSGAGVKVAFLDTGFSRDQPGRLLYGTTYGYHPYYEEYYADFLANRFTGHIVDGLHYQYDSNGHGTAMVSNLLAVAPNINLDFYPISELAVPEDQFLAALADNPDVISCSWGVTNGNPENQPVLISLIRQAVENGIIVVFSAGNLAPSWPGTDPSVVSVGGTYVDSTGSLHATPAATAGNNNGRYYPDVCGVVGLLPKAILIEMPTEPTSYVDVDYYNNGEDFENGDETTSTDGWFVASGTSSAAPQVAGLAALIRQQEPDINQGRFKHLIMTTCTDVVTGGGGHNGVYPAQPGFDLATGAGLIDCYRAVKTMVQMSSSDIYKPTTLPQDNYVNFYSFSGPHGASYHIDTTDGTTCGYTFFGYLASRDGAFMSKQDGIRVMGWFRQYDTFTPDLRPGRRYLNLYVVSVDGQQIIKSTKILDENSGTDWVFIDVVITGLSEYGMVRLAIGRGDCWQKDWHLTGEWADVNVYSFSGWQDLTIPDGYQVHFGPSLAPDAYMGTTYRVDTISTGQRLFYFGGFTDFYPYLYPFYTISVGGWFRQDDTFTPNLQPGRRYLDIYLVRPSDFAVVASHRILNYYDGTDWVYRQIEFAAPPDLGVYLFLIGRYDSWSTDWHLTGEWCNVQISALYVG